MRWIKSFFLSQKHVRSNWLIADGNLLMCGFNVSILVSSAQHVLKLLKTAVLGSSAIFD